MAKTAATGYGPTVMVAIEQRFPESARIINDDLAARILPAATRLMMLLWPRDLIVARAEKRAPGVWGSILCRKRYIDDKLAEARGEKPKSTQVWPESVVPKFC